MITDIVNLYLPVQSNASNQHQSGHYYTMSGGVASYMSSPAPSVVAAHVPECSDLEARTSTTGDFSIANNSGMGLSSNGNAHIDYYERSLYDEFTLKHQQPQVNHPRAVSIEGANGTSNTSNLQRFPSSSVSSNSYTINGNTAFRGYSHSPTVIVPPNMNNFQQLPCFNETSQHQTRQNLSNRHSYVEKSTSELIQPPRNGHTSNSRLSDLGEEVGSLAALDGLTDLLPMMPTSEAVKLSLRDIDGVEDEHIENKTLTNNNSLVLIGSSPTSPNSSNSCSMTLKNWDESGSVGSSHSSTFSSSETPPPQLHPSPSLYSLQPLKPLYQQQDTITKIPRFSYFTYSYP